jgi:hypothetical protein
MKLSEAILKGAELAGNRKAIGWRHKQDGSVCVLGAIELACIPTTKHSAEDSFPVLNWYIRRERTSLNTVLAAMSNGPDWKYNAFMPDKEYSFQELAEYVKGLEESNPQLNWEERK